MMSASIVLYPAPFSNTRGQSRFFLFSSEESGALQSQSLNDSYSWPLQRSANLPFVGAQHTIRRACGSECGIFDLHGASMPVHRSGRCSALLISKHVFMRDDCKDILILQFSGLSHERFGASTLTI